MLKPRRLMKGLALSFALGAILSVGSEPKLIRQVEAIALSKAQATATIAMQSLSATLGHWLQQGLNAALREITKQFTSSE
jgi:hypothetical protein